jgi:hypothetical protein
MANPTTNYGFVLPTPTDLVTDLPADFDVALQGVDTRLKALQPGTTLGDLAYSSATANTNTRLAVGANGTYLTVTAGVPAWGAISAGGMTLLSTTSLSGTTTTVSSINGTYNNLQIIVQGTSWATDASFLTFKFNGADNVFATGTRTIVSTNTLRVTDGSFGSTEYMMNANANNVYVFEVTNYANTSTYKGVKFFCNGAAGNPAANSQLSLNLMGAIKTNSAITSFSVTNNEGYAFNAGQILIYGVK